MKLYRYFFWLLILLLPVQLGRHFWPSWTQVLGLRIDYLSPTLYLTDLLVLGVLFSWFLQKRNHWRQFYRGIKKHWWLMAALAFLTVNCLMAANPGAAFYQLIKIVKLALLAFYVSREKYTWSDLYLPLSLAVVYSSLLALLQFWQQTSLGGLWWWLGERSFNLMTPGIAKSVVGGKLMMRPYGTFPHPNVLAGFLLVAMVVVGVQKKAKSLWWWLVMTLGGLTIIVSFSRVTWLVGLLIGLGFIVLKFSKKRWRFLVGGVVLFLLLIGFYLALSLSGQETIDQRLALAQVALKMVADRPLGGVALNNFIPLLPLYWQPFGTTYWLQPVHNIYLLVAAETGLTGLLVFLWLLILTLRRIKIDSRLLVVWLVILALGLVDHYWLTLQQSQLLLAIVFGLSWRG